MACSIAVAPPPPVPPPESLFFALEFAALMRLKGVAAAFGTANAAAPDGARAADVLPTKMRPLRYSFGSIGVPNSTSLDAMK